MDSTPEVSYIYALCCPETTEIRYVGKSKSPIKRYWQHIASAKRGIRQVAVGAWLREIFARGQRPVMKILEESDESGWADEERYWIARFRAEGKRLLNQNEGGHGHHNINEEIRRRMGVNRGRKFSDEVRRKMSLGHLGKQPSRKTIDALIERNRTIPFSDERRRKIGAAHRGKTISPEHRAAISAAHKGKKRPAEVVKNQADRLAVIVQQNDQRAKSMIEHGKTPSEVISNGLPLSSLARALGVSRYIAKRLSQTCE